MNLAVIFAGGVGSRMNNTSCPKQFLELNGKPVIIYTLSVFDRHPLIDGIIISCIQEWIPALKDMIEQFHIKKVISVVSGGKTGQLSIYNALCEAEHFSQKHSDNPIVLIHDGVRPLIDENTISENISKTHKYGNCITCIPATESFIIKHTNESISIPTRANSLVARAPQSFFLKDIMQAHRKALSDGKNDFIDSCTMMNHYGYDLSTTIGPMENIKITTPSDFFMFRAIIAAKENQQIFGL